MADEIQGEEEVKKEDRDGVPGEGFEEGGEGMPDEPREGEASVAPSLVSDFCRESESREEEGEGYWVCQEMEGEEESYEGYRYPTKYEEEQEVEEEEEELPDLTAEERQTLDSQYLKSVLGTPLTFALLDIAMKRPTDPIQYLGSYLLKWRWTNMEKGVYEAQMKELNEERQAYREKLRERERQLMLEKEEREEDYRRGEKDESTTEDDEERSGEGRKLQLEG